MAQVLYTLDAFYPVTGIEGRPTVRDPEGAPVLTIEALGTPILRLGGTTLVFSRRKSAAVLLYLAVTRRAHSRDALADLFWGELSQERAMANLRKVIVELRERVDDAVLITRETLAANPDYPILLDVAAFEAAIDRGIATADSEVLAHAVRRYADDFLAGFSVAAAEAFDEWAMLHREQLREQLLAALETLTAIQMDRGEYRAALGPARRVVALDPWREAGQRQLMRVLVGNGDRAAAVAQYEACRRTLAEELGVEPAAETVALYEQLLAGTGSPGTDDDRHAQVWGGKPERETVRIPAHRRLAARRRGRSLIACSRPGLMVSSALPGSQDHEAQQHRHAPTEQSGPGEPRGKAALPVYAVAANC